MADKKISALTAATTPLAGTEVLPIVQSGSTVKVANNDLRPKQIQSNATSGVLQVVGPAASATRVMTVPDGNFTAARTDAAQSFTGDQTLGTGNLIQGTAAKGVNFTANTPAAGMTSQLLNWYEEGTWTPTLGGLSGGALTYTTQTGRYTRVGRQVTAYFYIEVNTNTNTSGNVYLTMPFASDAAGYDGLVGMNTSGNTSINHISFYSAGSTPYFYTAGGGTLNGGVIYNGCVLSGTITYFV